MNELGKIGSIMAVVGGLIGLVAGGIAGSEGGGGVAFISALFFGFVGAMVWGWIGSLLDELWPVALVFLGIFVLFLLLQAIFPAS